jgi:hypothetical protein
MNAMSGNCGCTCCQIHSLLNELGALMIKQRCAMLFQQGYTRDEVNDVLNAQMIPELNQWVADMMRGFTDELDARGHTLN